MLGISILSIPSVSSVHSKQRTRLELTHRRRLYPTNFLRYIKTTLAQSQKMPSPSLGSTAPKLALHQYPYLVGMLSTSIKPNKQRYTSSYPRVGPIYGLASSAPFFTQTKLTLERMNLHNCSSNSSKPFDVDSGSSPT